MNRIDFFRERNYLGVSEQEMTVVVKNKDKMHAFVDFFSKLILPLIETYLVTLTAIQQICGKNLILKHRKLVQELHNCIKVLHVNQVLSNPISCVVEIIETAVFRFVQLSFLETRAYVTNKGNTTLYTHCPQENKPKIDALWAKLVEHRKISLQY